MFQDLGAGRGGGHTLLPAHFRLQGTRPIVGWLRMGDGSDLKSSPWTSNLAGPRACARTAHGTRGSLARWPRQSLPHQFAGRVSASANPRQRPCFRAYQPAYHPCAYRPRCKVLTGSHVAFRAHQAAHRPLETPAEKCAFAVKQAVKCSPEKCGFVGNRPGNHALVTIQQMPDCVDTGMDTAPIQPAEMSQMP